MPRAWIRCRRCRRAAIRCCRPARAASRAMLAVVLRPASAGLPVRRGIAAALLCRLSSRHGRPRCCSARCSRSASRSAIRPLLQVAAAGRGRAGRRQPDPGAAPHVGDGGRADAVAGARRGVRRHGARQLQLDRRLDGHDAQSRPVRDAVAELRSADDCGFRRRWRRRLPAMPGVERVQMVRNARIDFRRHAGHGRRRSRWSSIAETAHAPAGRRRRRRDVPPGRGRRGRDRLRQPRAAAAPALGDIVEIAAPYGLDPAADRRDHRRLLGPAGTIFMDRSVFVRYWHDDSVNVFRVYLSPGADAVGRAAADPRALRGTAPGVRADQRGARRTTSWASPISGSA